MYISEDAVPVSEREHIARLYRIIARDIETCDEKIPSQQKRFDEIDWNTVITPLHVASSIEDLSADTSYVDDTQSVAYCSPAAAYEDTHSKLMSQYIKELTVFVWTWLAFENTIKILCKVRYRVSTRHALAFIRDNVGVVQLHGLENIVQKASSLAPAKVREQAIKTSKDEPNFLFIHLCREARNHIIHGDATIPSPADVEYSVESDSHSIFVRSLTQLVLFAIQTLLFAAFQGVSHRTSIIMESWGIPKNLLIQDALRVLHLDGEDYCCDQRQSEFNFDIGYDNT